MSMNNHIGIILTAFAVVSLSGCGESEPCLKCLEDEELEMNRVTVSVVSSDVLTRAAEDHESDVRNVSLYVFSEEGETVNSFSNGTGVFDMYLPSGKYTFRTFVNCVGLPLNPQSGSDLDEAGVRLSGNGEGGFQMTGSATEEILQNRAVTVKVHRLVSKVEWVVHTAFDEFHRDAELVVRAVYLTNVVGGMDFSLKASARADDWYNRMFYAASDVDELLIDRTGFVLSDGDTAVSSKPLYALPNSVADNRDKTDWTPRCTRLVVEADYCGDSWYYPVTFPALAPNTAYVVDLTVKGPGLEHPEDTVKGTAAVEVRIEVVPWEDGGTIRAEY